MEGNKQCGSGMKREDCTRKWTAAAGPSWWCPPKCCVFCDHCTDIFWDYTNGPYLISCDIEKDPGDGGYEGNCDSFIEETDETERQR